MDGPGYGQPESAEIQASMRAAPSPSIVVDASAGMRVLPALRMRAERTERAGSPGRSRQRTKVVDPFE